ncbi:MAG: DUF4105 domain-containing protein [Nitrospiraceae bacterium]
MSPIRIAVLLFFSLLSAALCVAAESTAPSAVAQNNYLLELQSRAAELRLAEAREWQVLLRYRPQWMGGVASQQDDPRFFLAPAGKTDAVAELEATLTAFFSDRLVGRSQQPAQCAFVGRYHWLREQLQFDDSRLMPNPCERFQRWFDEFKAAGVTVIVPAGFMNNPSSMFGHTFLRIDQRGQTDQTRILAYTINYAAELPPDAGVEYAFKGVFGGYSGFYTTIPYYLKVQEYRDLENRDIWEYRLNLTPTQVRRMLMHAWEMGNASFDYFFFGENCSYHMLSLLDAADPSFRLADQFPAYTLPTDTIRVLMAVPGLVGPVTYRPSRRTVVQRKRAQLSAEEDQWLLRGIADPTALRSDVFRDLAAPRQALVLDTASDYLLMRGEGSGPDDDKGFRAKNRQVLTTRSQLKTPSPDVNVAPLTERPDIGHGTTRASVGAGWRNNALYEEASFRLAYHDLLDPQPGYTPDAQIEAMSVSLRHYHRYDQSRVERFTLLNMTSLSPMDRLFHAPSWRLNLGMNTIRHGGCQLCSNGLMSAGIGGAVESTVLRRELWFAFADAEGNYSRAYDERHRAGGGGTVGLLTDITERWKLLASASYFRYVLGEHSEEWRWTVGHRVTLSRNWALRLDYSHRPHDNDVLLAVQAFF